MQSSSIHKHGEIFSLIVDDNFDNRVIMRSILTEMGIEAQTLMGGWQLLNKPIQRPVDLILLDLQMPLLDGFETAQQIRQQRLYATAKLVAVTANRDPAATEQALRAGFHGYILKPFDREQFKRRINQILTGGIVWEGRFSTCLAGDTR